MSCRHAVCLKRRAAFRSVFRTSEEVLTMIASLNEPVKWNRMPQRVNVAVIAPKADGA